MAGPSAAPFTPPVIPWRQAQRLSATPELGPGLDPHRCGVALGRLGAEPDVEAVLVFGSRARGEARLDSDLDLAVIVRQPQLTPAEKLAWWRRFHGALGRLGVKVDLVAAGSMDAERLSRSCWHVFGDVAYPAEDWGFTAQQTVEKLLKAWIVLADRRLPRVHEREDLADLAGQSLDPRLLELQVFAVEARYDEGSFPLPAARDVLLALIEAELDRCAMKVKEMAGLEGGKPS